MIYQNRTIFENLVSLVSFLTYDTADDIIASLEIIEKLFFPETDLWRNNYLNTYSNRKRFALDFY